MNQRILQHVGKVVKDLLSGLRLRKEIALQDQLRCTIFRLLPLQPAARLKQHLQITKCGRPLFLSVSHAQ